MEHFIKVEIIWNNQYWDYKKWDIWYIIWFTRWVNDTPYASIVSWDRILLVNIEQIKVIDSRFKFN